METDYRKLLVFLILYFEFVFLFFVLAQGEMSVKSRGNYLITKPAESEIHFVKLQEVKQLLIINF